MNKWHSIMKVGILFGLLVAVSACSGNAAVETPFKESEVETRQITVYESPT